MNSDMFDEYHQELCEKCGECLHECPVMQLPLEKAKAEMRNLIAGRKNSVVLKKCTSCMSCNFVCKKGCNPSMLILKRWHEAYEEGGMPERATWFTPHMRPNFRTYVLDRMPEDEKALIKKWDNESPSEEIIYPGCNVITTPYLMMSSLFEGKDIRGSLDLCCGEMYFRSGHFDELRRTATRLTGHFRKMGIKKMLIPCTAGRNLFTNVLPKYGAKFDFEIEHVIPWLINRIESGELKVTKTLDMTVTIQESCHAKCFGDEFIDMPRKLLKMLGAKVIEEEQHGKMMRCCGIGGGFSHASNYHPFNVVMATGKALSLAKSTKADAVVTYCAGCMQQLGVGRLMLPFLWTEIYHILELVQIAIGEVPKRRLNNRAFLLASGVVLNQMPKLLSAKRHKAGTDI
jgi:Fe-S oxidoreductase